MIARLQYITQDNSSKSHAELVQLACEAGIKWVQLRMKNQPTEGFLQEALIAREICTKFGAQLIINDNVKIAKLVKADGVHLGQEDIQPAEARKTLGEKSIIGGTANTLDNLQYLIEQKVDYIGLGPYQYTVTKKNLSPVLGVKGYLDLLHKVRKEVKNVNIPPLIAVGGINLCDITSLMETEIYGVAVSGALTKDFTQTPSFIYQINQAIN